MKKYLIASLVVFSLFLLITDASAQRFKLEKDQTKKIDAVTKTEESDKNDVLKKLKLIKGKDLNAYKHYWKREITNGQNIGEIYGYKVKLDDGNDLIFTQMRSIISCVDSSFSDLENPGEQCEVKAILQKGNGDFETVFGGIFFKQKEDELILTETEQDKDSLFPMIQIYDYKFTFDKDKKYYEIIKDSKKMTKGDSNEESPLSHHAPYDLKESLERYMKKSMKKSGLESLYSFFTKFDLDTFDFSLISKASAEEIAAEGGSCPWLRPSASAGSGFRSLTRPNHIGCDYPTGCVFTPQVAIGPGIVTAVGRGCISEANVDNSERAGDKYRDCYGGAGNFVDIEHPDGTKTRYFHLEDNIPSHIVKDLEVEAGTIIGNVGNSGNSTGCHLHLEIHDPVEGPVDPELFLASCGAETWDGTGGGVGSGNIYNDPTPGGGGGAAAVKSNHERLFGPCEIDCSE